MAYKALTVAELLALMKKIQGEKTNTEFAAELGISKQYLTDMYSGRKAPSDNVSSQLGFQQKIETRYIPSSAGRCPGEKRWLRTTRTQSKASSST
jgi:hypothetical protein